MSQNTTFEVHVQRGGQWTIHQTYKGHQREEAVEEAKVQLSERSDFQAVKVVREIFDPDSGIFKDSVIFKAEAGARKLPQGHGGAGGKTATLRRGGAAGNLSGLKEELSLRSILVRFLLVILFSVILAGLLGFGTAELLGGTKTFGVRWVGQAETNLLVGTFIITFITTFMICVASLTLAVMRNVKLKKGRKGRLSAWLAAWAQKP